MDNHTRRLSILLALISTLTMTAWRQDSHTNSKRPADDPQWSELEASMNRMHSSMSSVRPSAYRIFYLLTKPLLPLLRRAFPNYVLTTQQIGRAILNVTRKGYQNKVLESKDIRAAADL